MMKILITTVISGFLFFSVSASATDHSQMQNKADDRMNQPRQETNEMQKMQKMQKLEKEEYRHQQQKQDVDPRGRVEENKEHSDTEGPRGAGVQ